MAGSLLGFFKRLTLGDAPAALGPASSAADEPNWPAMKVAFPTVTVVLVEPNQAIENGTRLSMEKIANKTWTVLTAIAHAQTQLQNPQIPLSRHGLLPNSPNAQQLSLSPTSQLSRQASLEYCTS